MIIDTRQGFLPYLVRTPFVSHEHYAVIHEWCLIHLGQMALTHEVTGFFDGHEGPPRDEGGQWYWNGSRWRFRTYAQAFDFVLRWKR